MQRYVAPLLAQGADTLVLGCTHYPFVLPAIEKLIGDTSAQPIVLIDTGDAVARQLSRLLGAADLLRAPSDTPAQLRGYASAAPDALARAFSTLLALSPPVELLQIEGKIAKVD